VTSERIAIYNEVGDERGHVTRVDGKWTPHCGTCDAPGLRPVGYPATAVQMLLVHLEWAHKDAA
jgi:hypothetical protein